MLIIILDIWDPVIGHMVLVKKREPTISLVPLPFTEREVKKWTGTQSAHAP